MAEQNFRVKHGLEVNGTALATTLTVTVATTSATTLDTFAIATYRSARYNIQITQGTDYQVSEVLLIHDGTTASIFDFATLATGSTIATYSATISGGNALLQVIMGSATSSTVKVLAFRTSI